MYGSDYVNRISEALGIFLKRSSRVILYLFRKIVRWSERFNAPGIHPLSFRGILNSEVIILPHL